MTTIRSVALLVALVVGLTVAPLASGAVVNPFAEPATGQSEANSTNASVGTLMQASAADAESSVETGLFEVAYENADNESRTAILTQQTAKLESQLVELEAERERLQAERENGTISKGAYQSRMAKIAVEIASLERSIERTEQHADEAGVGQERLAALRANAVDAREDASERAGPQAGDVARGLANGGGPPDKAGSPEDRGPDGQSAGNGPDDEPAAGSDGKPSGNGSDGKPTTGSDGEEAGTGSDDSPSGTTDSDSPDDAGSGTGGSGTGTTDEADTDG